MSETPKFATERLHNICAAMEEHINESPFTRNEMLQFLQAVNDYPWTAFLLWLGVACWIAAYKQE